MVAFATQVKRRRGTTAQNDAFTGAEGEIVVDTERHELRVHDGVTMGGFKIGGGTSLLLLTPMWFDHIANDMSWLRADTFSWQSGDVYVAAYNHLVDDFNNGSKTLIPEGAGIWCHVAPDGHRIVRASDTTQVTNVENLYEATGVAWYYILDTKNRQFKLPRTKWGFTGLRDSVGGYVPQNVLLPNITGVVTGLGDVSVSGAFTRGSKVAGNGGGDGSITADNFDASRSSSVYSGDGTNTLIQPRATQMYLYFYVGNFEQSAIEQTAGLNAEMFNNKADLNLMNTASNVDFVVESQLPTADNDYTWYRKYKSGWVEQGGIKTITMSVNGADTVITLPVVMSTSYYTIGVTLAGTYGGRTISAQKSKATTTTIKVGGYVSSGTESNSCYWQVSGMAAQ